MPVTTGFPWACAAGCGMRTGGLGDCWVGGEMPSPEICSLYSSGFVHPVRDATGRTVQAGGALRRDAKGSHRSCGGMLLGHPARRRDAFPVYKAAKL